MDFRNTIWVSHSSLSDFENCPRLYYLKNIYRDPKTNNRLQLVNPYLSLGSSVHNTLESLSDISISKRKKLSWLKKFDEEWIGGKKGGYGSIEKEKFFYNRGIKMIKMAQKSEILYRQAYKFPANFLPKTTLFPGVELVGSLDWAEILEDNSLHIVDFKTGAKEEKDTSLQLPIYRLLAENNFESTVSKLSYWYLDKEKLPQQKEVPELSECLDKIKKRAQVMVDGIKNKAFACTSNYRTCFKCRDYEKILTGEAEFIGSDPVRKKDLYYLPNGTETLTKVLESLEGQEQEIFRLRIEGCSIKEIGDKLKKTSKQVNTSGEKIKKQAKEILSAKELKHFVMEMQKIV
jgi:hypothetical protein